MGDIAKYPGDGQSLARWEVVDPSIQDIYELINQAGQREFYTWIITGVPSRDSPKVGARRGWTEGQTVTLGFVKDSDEVAFVIEQNEAANQAAADEGGWDAMEVNVWNAADFCTALTSAEELEWYEVSILAILNRNPKI